MNAHDIRLACEDMNIDRLCEIKDEIAPLFDDVDSIADAIDKVADLLDDHDELEDHLLHIVRNLRQVVDHLGDAYQQMENTDFDILSDVESIISKDKGDAP